jgi:23S rRNA pseudouridine1911/1915/1917 synthase
MSNLNISQAQRLDQYVAKQLPTISRASAAKLVNNAQVSVNGEAVTKPGYKLRFGDNIVIDYDENTADDIPEITLPILYEDDDCVVISKPAGLLTHSKGEYNPEATVASWLSSRTAEMTGERAGIVHRLDRATSGVMIGAKNPVAMRWLQKQFAQRRVKKTSVALIVGVPEHAEAVIDMPIERNPKAPQTFRTGVNGKSATTNYRVLKTKGRLSMLELKPTTGRTHQLRVHLKQLGHPIIGDTLYVGEPADRLYLHAESLELTLPSRERKVFTSPVPKEFMDKLKNDSLPLTTS